MYPATRRRPLPHAALHPRARSPRSVAQKWRPILKVEMRDPLRNYTGQSSETTETSQCESQHVQGLLHRPGEPLKYFASTTNGTIFPKSSPDFYRCLQRPLELCLGGQHGHTRKQRKARLEYRFWGGVPLGCIAASYSLRCSPEPGHESPPPPFGWIRRGFSTMMWGEDHTHPRFQRDPRTQPPPVEQPIPPDNLPMPPCMPPHPSPSQPPALCFPVGHQMERAFCRTRSPMTLPTRSSIATV